MALVNLERYAESENNRAIGEIVDRWRIGIGIGERGCQIFGNRPICTQHPVDIIIDADNARRISERSLIDADIALQRDGSARNTGRSTGIDIDIVRIAEAVLVSSTGPSEPDTEA